MESGGPAAQILVEPATTLEPGPRAATLLTEAAIRLMDAGEEGGEAEQLLTRAAAADPKQPVAMYIGESSARRWRAAGLQPRSWWSPRPPSSRARAPRPC